MDPIDSQIQQAASRSSVTEFVLTIAAGIVFFVGLTAGVVMGGPAIVWGLSVSLTAAAILLGIAAHLSINRARLLLAWREQ